MSKIDYSQIQVEEFLQGMHNVRKDGREIFFSCPFPGHSHGDALPSASMQIGTTKVHCFGCGFNGNALTFLAEYENISPLKAARYIREYLGTAFKEPEGALVEEIDAILSPKVEVKRERNKPLIRWNYIKELLIGAKFGNILQTIMYHFLDKCLIEDLVGKLLTSGKLVGMIFLEDLRFPGLMQMEN
jgi:hypothetical protein